MKGKKKDITFIIIFFLSVTMMLAYLFQSSYAKYRKNIEAESSLRIASWDIKLNNESLAGKTKLTNNLTPTYIENEYVKISFIDHGIGIAKEHINDIWNRYYKTNKNHDRKHEGSGIGLSIVKSVLDRYGAEYGVESEEGKGSEFWFKLKKIDRN